MTIREQIMAGIKTAMKDKNSTALQTLRLVASDCKNQEIASKAPLNDQQVVSVLKKQIKQYQETIAQYQQMDRSEDVQNQTKRMNIVQSYLPQSLSEEKLRSLVDQKIQELEASSVKQMGLVIKAVQAEASGMLVDNRLLAQLVKEKLQNL